MSKQALLNNEDFPGKEDDVPTTKWEKYMSVVSAVILSVIVAPYFSEQLYVVNLAVWTNNNEFCAANYEDDLINDKRIPIS
jgi:hypothetical protein